jgi:hypothetical protein
MKEDFSDECQRGDTSVTPLTKCEKILMKESEVQSSAFRLLFRVGSEPPLGPGQYRNAVASGRAMFRASPDATALRY